MTNGAVGRLGRWGSFFFGARPFTRNSYTQFTRRGTCGLALPDFLLVLPNHSSPKTNLPRKHTDLGGWDVRRVEAFEWVGT
jgi:hypothetical protein